MTAKFHIQLSHMWSLGIYKPKVFDVYPIADGLARFINARVTNVDSWQGCHRAEVRSPEYSTEPFDDVDEWHQDGMPFLADRQEEGYLIMWASQCPTEIKVKKPKPKSRQIYQAEPFEVIVFDNEFFKHRCPSVKGRTPDEATDRWFARMHAPAYAQVLDKSGVFAYTVPSK